MTRRSGCLGLGSGAAHASLHRDGAVWVSAGFARPVSSDPSGKCQHRFPRGGSREPREPGGVGGPARQVALWHRLTETALGKVAEAPRNRLRIALVTRSLAFAERPETRTHALRALPSPPMRFSARSPAGAAEGKGGGAARGRLKNQPWR